MDDGKGAAFHPDGGHRLVLIAPDIGLVGLSLKTEPEHGDLAAVLDVVTHRFNQTPHGSAVGKTVPAVPECCRVGVNPGFGVVVVKPHFAALVGLCRDKGKIRTFGF